jgi:hypothetical protein
MVTVGLVRELTAEAARQAALGAGAKLVGSHRLPADRARTCRRSLQLAPDHAAAVRRHRRRQPRSRAQRAAPGQAGLACPIVVAGNREAADEVRDALPEEVSLTDNVMPEFNVLVIEPARAAIREVFMSASCTPRASTGRQPSSTRADAHAGRGARRRAPAGRRPARASHRARAADGGRPGRRHHRRAFDRRRRALAARRGAQGLPEPHAKRTVEGDLGMRHNAASIVEAAGEAPSAEAAGDTWRAGCWRRWPPTVGGCPPAR